jgi:hypothetical protein
MPKRVTRRIFRLGKLSTVRLALMGQWAYGMKRTWLRLEATRIFTSTCRPSDWGVLATWNQLLAEGTQQRIASEGHRLSPNNSLKLNLHISGAQLHAFADVILFGRMPRKARTPKTDSIRDIRTHADTGISSNFAP